MVSMAIAAAPGAMATIASASAEGDLDAIRREVHDLGSNFGSYGAQRLCDHARSLEKACREADRDSAGRLADRLPELLEEAVGLLRIRSEEHTSELQSLL